MFDENIKIRYYVHYCKIHGDMYYDFIGGYIRKINQVPCSVLVPQAEGLRVCHICGKNLYHKKEYHNNSRFSKLITEFIESYYLSNRHYPNKNTISKFIEENDLYK